MATKRVFYFTAGQVATAAENTAIAAIAAQVFSKFTTTTMRADVPQSLPVRACDYVCGTSIPAAYAGVPVIDPANPPAVTANKTVIFFVAGIVPTVAEVAQSALFAALAIPDYVLHIKNYSTALESPMRVPDFVSGSVPAAYSAIPVFSGGAPVVPAPTVTSQAVIVGTPQQNVPLNITAAVFGGTVVSTSRKVWRVNTDTTLTQVFAGTTSQTYTPVAADVTATGLYVVDTAQNTGGTVNSTSATKAVSAAATATLRQVATGTHIMNTLAASNTTTCSRTPHILMSAVTSLAIVLPNWYVGAQAELAAGSATWTASIEYPAGTYQQVLFGGVASVTSATGGNIVSDQMPVSIPKGAKFWVRLFQNAPSKAIYFNYYAGDGTGQFVSPATDMTMGGTIATGGPAFQGAITCPIAIIGMSSDPAVAAYGDSIAVGRGDTADAGVPLQGHLGRSFGASYAMGHVAISGDRISTFLAGNSKRMSLAAYFTHIAINMGINDVSNGDSAATVASNTNAMVNLFSGKPVALCTLSPVSSSTDAWATTANQTAGSLNGIRVTENTRRNAGVSGVKVIYDVNPAVESVASPESGIWKAPSYTADGTHPTVTGYKAEVAAMNIALLFA